MADNSNERIVKGVPPRPSPLQAVVAGNYWTNTFPNQPVSLSADTLLQVCEAPPSDALTVTSVGPTRSPGGTAQMSGSTITYSPADGFVGLDSFTYTIMDARGATTQGTALVAVTASPTGAVPAVGIKTVGPNSTTIRFAGLPGIAYHVDVSTDLIHWTEIGIAVANSDNLVEFTDTATSGDASRFYRTRMP